MTNTSAVPNEKVTFQTLGESALQAEIEIKAPLAKVYAAWTDPTQLPRWFGPRADGRLQIDHFDCTVGGRYDLTMIFADGDRVQIVGAYQELDPPKKIVFTWQWSESPGMSSETLITVDLAPTSAGTHLTLKHERFVSADDRDLHRSGWEPILYRLAAVLTD